MSNIKANGFGVRFFRRGIQARINKTALQDNSQLAMEQPASSQIAEDFPNLSKGPAMELAPDTGDAPTRNTPVTDSVPAPKCRKICSEAMPAPKEQALWFAAREGNCARIRQLVMDGVDLEARDPQGRTAINIATQYNRGDAIKTLMAAREMRRMAALGLLPETHFFRRFSKIGTYDKK